MKEFVIENHLVGCSRVMRRLRSDILKLARGDLAVLVQGPTGAGKELVAEAVHRASGRTGAFVAFNVCAITESMFEGTLFGHVRGAFTGAFADVPGYLAEAHGGTLFLDEIGGLPGSSQAKLLRVLETKEYRPVGGRGNKLSAFRMVAATSAEILDEVGAGRFRADLAYRLSGDVLHVPGLEERREDISSLAAHFLRRIEAETGRLYALTSEATALLTRSEWPGNARELRNVVSRAATYAASATIDRDDVAHALDRRGRQRVAPVDDPRRKELVALLERFTWKVDAVAREMEVHPVTVYRRMKQYAVRKPATLGRTLSTHPN